MKYESTILKRLIDTYGVVGNPRYISEIIKEFIVRGKECFPNLFTYQADWLAHIDEFGLNPTYTVSYTGQSIYAPNTLERPVKSAILKGSTKYRDIETGEILEVFEDGRNLELVSVKMPVLTTTGKNAFNINAYTSLRNNTTIEGEWLIFWENYQSSESKWDVTLAPNTSYYVSDFIDSDITTNNSSGRFRVVDKMGNEILKLGGFNRLLTTTNESDYIFEIGRGSGFVGSITKFKIQIEQGTVATSYEPFKSNILTVNEEVELRGIGDVRDTLDLMTGEVVECIGEIIIDENSNIAFPSYCENVDEGYFKFATDYIEQPKNNNYISNKFQKNNVYELTNAVGFKLVGGGGKHRFLFCIKSSELSELSLNGCKQWLSQNPITIQYALETESVKTVGLSIVDQNNQSINKLTTFKGGTHFTTSSQDGSLLPTLTVDVVTDLEEILMVCSSEGNTM